MKRCRTESFVAPIDIPVVQAVDGDFGLDLPEGFFTYPDANDDRIDIPVVKPADGDFGLDLPEGFFSYPDASDDRFKQVRAALCNLCALDRNSLEPEY